MFCYTKNMDLKESFEQQFIDAYDLYAEAIYRHCLFRLYSKEKAEEMMQEAFMKTWQYLAKGNQVENIRAFLYRVTNNLIIDYSRKKREDSLEMLMEMHPDFEPSTNPTPQFDNTLMVQTVFEEMKKLSAEMRQIITMRHVDDLDPKEIGEILGISPNNVSVRINRALRQLQQILNQNHHDQP